MERWPGHGLFQAAGLRLRGAPAWGDAYKPGTLCASPIARRRMKWALWTATIV